MAEVFFAYLHGFTSSPASAKARFFRERLAGCGVELHAPDLNEGEGGFFGLTLSRSLAQVRDLLDQHGAERAVLIGSSLGGYTAALAATRDPRIEGLVLLCPAFDLPARWSVQFGEEAIGRWRREGSAEVDHTAWGRKERLGFPFYRDAMGHSPFPPVRVPTLIHHGRADESVPVESSRKYAADLPNVRLIEYDSDHALADVLDPIWEETRTFLAPWLPR